METNLIFSLLMPIGMGIIMLGLGLSLTIHDFTRILAKPKPILTGLFVQLIVLPLLCFIMVKMSHFSPEISIGFLLLAAAPGGPSSNLYSHLSGGDVALNISLTAINSVLSVIFLPLIVNLAIIHFAQDGEAIPLQFRKIMEVFMIVILPITVGMSIHYKWGNIALKMEKPVKIMSVIFLASLIIAAIISQGYLLKEYLYTVGAVALLFNITSLCIGYLVPYVLKMGKRQALAISMELGIHNGSLAIFIALNVIGNTIIGIPAAIYSILMFFTATAFAYLTSRNLPKKIDGANL